MTESEVKAQIKSLLDWLGWEWVDTSDSRPARRQLRGLPDLLAWKADCTLLIEAKAADGRLRPDQVAFHARIAPHLGGHLRYVVARCAEDVQRAIDGVGSPANVAPGR